MRVAKTMRHRIAEAEAHGKKPSSYYSRMLKEARRRTLEELSVALGADEDAVEERFKQPSSKRAKSRHSTDRRRASI